MDSVKQSQAEVIDRLVEVFREYGYEGASLASLSKATGLGRSSLYHHFPNGKEDMAKVALARIDDWFIEHALKPLKASGTIREKLVRFTDQLCEFYSDGRKSCLMAAFGTGEAAALFRPGLERSLNTLIETLAQSLVQSGISPAEAKRRAEDALITIQGAIIISRTMNSTSPFRRSMMELPDRLLDVSRS